MLVCSASGEGGEGVTLVGGTTPAGPRRLWQQPMRQHGPQQARWAAPGCWLLQATHRNELSHDPPYRYLELMLPPAAGQR